jgi:hypothetical protein
MALAVPLFRLRFTSARQARFTSRVGGGSVFASLRRDESAFYDKANPANAAISPGASCGNWPGR